METAFDVTLVFSKKSTELGLESITEVTTRKSRAHTGPFGQVENRLIRLHCLLRGTHPGCSRLC